jgi:hypothetical protein
VKVLKSKDLSRPGNDCYIYEKISLVEEFDTYAVIVCEKVSGWAERNEVRVDHVSTDYPSALRYFNSFVSLREN